MLFADPTGCQTIECTNAPPGWYYTQVDKERTAYLDNLECPIARCKPPKPDRRFVPGFATDTNACPTQPCDMSRLPKGHYYQLTHDYTKCTPVPCELIAGHFYLHGAQGGQAGCAKVRSKCTNARLGQTYAQQTKLVTQQNGCPVRFCDDPPAGKDFATEKSCTAFVSCTTAALGQHYVQSPASNPCQVARCTNADVGEFYQAGNTNFGPDCAVGKCAVITGYTFNTPGDCWDMQRCAAREAGFYFKYSNDKLCAREACDYNPEGGWKFVAGFALRPGKCPRQKCAGAPPYVSSDSCDPATTAAFVTTASRAISDTDAAKSVIPSTQTTSHVVVYAVAGCGAALVLVPLVTLIYCCLRRHNCSSNNSMTMPLKSPKPTAYTNISETIEGDRAHMIAAKAASEMTWGDLLMNTGDVTLGRKLAQGSGGQIFSGRFAGSDVALKESYDMMMAERHDELVREASMMAKLKHHNIVRFFGIWQPPNEGEEEIERVFLVMELCSNGDLRDAAQDLDSTLRQRQQWITQVALAMQYLHGRTPPIVHRDLKPQNVLLDAEGNAKICDFGISKAMESSRDMTVGIGTVAYMAPEMMHAFSTQTPQADIDGTKCDVFSFAVLALYVATGEAPHAGLSNEDIFIKIGVRGGRPGIPRGYAGSQDAHQNGYDNFIELVNQMWHQRPEDRPDFGSIVSELTACFAQNSP